MLMSRFISSHLHGSAVAPFSTEEFDEAVQTAREERVNSTSRYLIGMPLLADYLEEGLEQLGISSEDAESEVL
jgi:hypothetical protein